MKNINSHRKFVRNKKEVNTDGDYILYWMQVNRRFQYNYALEYAVALGAARFVQLHACVRKLSH